MEAVTTSERILALSRATPRARLAKRAEELHEVRPIHHVRKTELAPAFRLIARRWSAAR
jgi:hypothetical protein